MKKIYILPNLITTANIVCGFFSMTSSFRGEFDKAAWYIVISGICDSLDGRVARMAKATTPFGVQYDSLADLTSFGIAPAILMFTYSLGSMNRVGVALATFYVICAALRLARFNVSADESNAPLLSPQASAKKKIRKGYFQGLPSPASAGIVVATVLFQNEFRVFTDDLIAYLFMALAGVLALAMVSSIGFPSFKEVNWRARGKAWILLIPVVVLLFLLEAPALTLFTIGYSYLILSLLWALYVKLKRTEMNGPLV